MGRKSNKSIEDQVSEIVETMTKQIAMLFLPATEFGKELEPDDIAAVADLASVPTEELILGLLSAHAIGYLGAVDDEDEKPKRKVA